jgi:undecaprenyl-diphosphatase
VFDVFLPRRTEPEQPLAAELPAPPPRFAAPLGVALLAATTLLAVLLRDPNGSTVQSVDNAWADLMPGSPGGLIGVAATVVEAGMGGPTGLMVPLGLVGWLLLCRRWWSALYALTACVLVNLALILPLKDLVDRAHPKDPWTLVSGASFPSGHAFGAASLVVVLGAVVCRRRTRRRWWPVGVLVTIAVMLSSTWVRDSWLSDTVGGALTGAGAALLLWRVFAPLLRREAQDLQTGFAGD